MKNTLKLLIRANLGNSTRYEVIECWRDEPDSQGGKRRVHEDWWVVNANNGDPVLAENTLEEAEIYCGLCNLLDTDDFDALEPYTRELLPHWFGESAKLTSPVKS